MPEHVIAAAGLGAAVVGWVVTHHDLLALPEFRRCGMVRWSLALGGPLAVLGGVQLVCLSLAGDPPCRWPVLIATMAFGLIGTALACRRPFRVAARVHMEANHGDETHRGG